MIELVIAVAVAGILTAIATNSFHTSQLKKEQDGVVQGIVSHLEKQRTDTQAGKDGSAYGIKFATTTYTMYKGTAYSPSSASNQSIEIDPDFRISTTISNGGKVIYFNRIDGEANETATVTVSHVLNKVPLKNIKIEQGGTISILE